MKLASNVEVLYHSNDFKETDDHHLCCPQECDTGWKYQMKKINNRNKFIEKTRKTKRLI